MPRWATQVLLILVLASFIPLAMVARQRLVPSASPRLSIIRDMDSQPKYRAQSTSPLFADGRSMRPPVAGTVARGELAESEHMHQGFVAGEWAADFPVSVDDALLKRGRERYNIYCAPCHGYAGYGDGAVNRRALELEQGTWTPPTSIHSDVVRERAPGHLYNTISQGIRSMPAYSSQIDVADRWAIVAYVKALQRSQNAPPEDDATAPGESSE